MQFLTCFLVSILSLIYTISIAQTAPAIISGTISSDSGEAMMGVIVQLKNTSKGTQTDLNGKYVLADITPGSYYILFTSIGYKNDSMHVHLHPGQVLQLNRKMSVDTLDKAIVITAKNEAEELRESGFSVNVIETKQYANTTADINQVLNRTSGIRIRESGGVGSDFNFSLNGLSGKQIKYFIDGIPIDVLGSSMTLNNVPVNLAERIEVYKGVVPVSLGSDAMGGAINIVTNQKVKNFLDASYSYGSFNTHRAAVTGQYTHTKTGLVVRTSSFYNFSNNNYIMRNVEVWDAAQYSFVEKNFRRFHDTYQSMMGQIEVGLMNKKWADVFFIGGAFSGYTQDVQTGFQQTIVYGRVTRKGHAFNGSVRYKKDNFLIKGLSMNVFASRSYDSYVVVDTTKIKYGWDGIGVTVPDPGYEMDGAKTFNTIVRPKSYLRTNLTYIINKNNSLNVNYTLDHLKNVNYNSLIENDDPNPGIMNKQILGIAYENNLFNQRLTTTPFVKWYGMGLNLTTPAVTKSTSFSNYGYGIASRFKFLRNAGIKASVEHAYRLQEVIEIFGDGMRTSGNPDLLPETSDNINTGLFYGKRFSKHSFFIEASAFYRNAKDFIYAIADQHANNVRYENKSSVRVTGLEGEIRYDYEKNFMISINASYQNALNYTKYSKAGNTIPEATYLNKIPNQPWFFSNLELSYGKNDVFGKKTRIQFNWYTQYVRWFYLTWEAFGGPEGKNKIPDQFSHNASVSYSMQEGRYNISLECRNLMNNLNYDNFMLQKPGRSFSVKFRYFIK
jgi:outer membrane receptor protein involved in Fe transport